ncbi:glycoside hydrolase superfamily [Aspergillus egyptiacus]|nr:glycoside hydrolase superfamily [Aspergillus egyptiacus]
MRLLSLLSLAATALAATPEQWRSQSIYFLMTDRFARTDGSTTAECDTSMRQYCGGTWQGIIDHLDYIQGMGFTAIWITPVIENLEEDTAYGRAFHGYWGTNIYNLNHHYGTEQDLRNLADALHDRGMYLMVDVVANHMGYNGAADSVDYSVFTPFNSQEYFNAPCFIQNYEDQMQVERCWLGDNSVPLPDLDTTRDDVKQTLYDWVGSLVSNYSIDGLRVDTVKHVQKDFWRDFNNAAGVYCVGEVFDGDPAYTCPYQGQGVLDGVLNYPMYYPVLNAFRSTSGSMSDLYNMIERVKYTCADSTLLGNFIENHDNPRLASYTTDLSLAANAAAFVLLADGIPIIYAGQEQHYAGTNDPYNREATWLSGYNRDSELYRLIGQSNAIRSHAIAQDEGYLSYMNWPIYQDEHTIAMRKGYDGSQTITVLTNNGAGSGSYTFSLAGTGYEAGLVLTEVYSCQRVTVAADGSVPVRMENGLPRVFYPSSRLEGSGICQ